MVKVAGFESVLSKANVGLNFFRSFVCHRGLVDYCLCLAFSLQWAGIFRAALPTARRMPDKGSNLPGRIDKQSYERSSNLRWPY